MGFELVHVLWSGIAMSIISLSGIFGLKMKKINLLKVVKPCMALASGSLFGGAMFHLLPASISAFASVDANEISTWLWFTLGFCSFMFVELFLHHKAEPKKNTDLDPLDFEDSSIEMSSKEVSQKKKTQEEKKDENTDDVDEDSTSVSHTKQSGDEETNKSVPQKEKSKLPFQNLSIPHMMLVGDSIHNFIGGLCIGAAFTIDFYDGLGSWLSAVAHEIFQEVAELTVFAVYFGNKKAIIYNYLSSLTFLLGQLTALALGTVSKAVSGALIGFGAGNFIYIAATDLLPEIVSTKNKAKQCFWNMVWWVVGTGLMILIKVIFQLL
ncbi:zinc transporter slc39a7 histidine-rich membrane protein ke4 [Anaeramoeba flamelloides]|uniref:Zinc transporter slc39a7 histidine-rich membrane protein ke4 n=1 Tax=Anaeramoeba flamelloides TaxID=1746091 RepID=A0ABQ8Z6L5_9EUKA|nr:zinc transporter slc39a7 histidine-rich membrane protein ke4 [Anaeramoeba flamelloides]